jgi:hypothetical protein
VTLISAVTGRRWPPRRLRLAGPAMFIAMI